MFVTTFSAVCDYKFLRAVRLSMEPGVLRRIVRLRLTLCRSGGNRFTDERRIVDRLAQKGVYSVYARRNLASIQIQKRRKRIAENADTMVPGPCELLNWNRSTVSFQRACVSNKGLALMRRIDVRYLQGPYGR